MTTYRHPRGTLRLPPRSQLQLLVPSAPTSEVALATPKPGKPAKAVSKTTVPDPAKIAARKRANVERERQTHEAAVLRHREQTREILALLRTRWPDLFSVHTPLATGITRAIQTELGEVRLPAVALSRALYWWTSAPSYLVAVAAGRTRRNLDGTEAGVPDEVQREAAAEALRQHAARRTTAKSGSKPRPRSHTALPPPERHGKSDGAAATSPPVAPPIPPDN